MKFLDSIPNRAQHVTPSVLNPQAATLFFFPCAWRDVKKMNALCRMILFGLSALLMGSCVSRLDSEIFNQLPKPSGIYGGSLIYEPWVYRGTDGRGNHFTYFWNRNNIVRDREFIAPTETVANGDRINLTTDRKAWRAVRPILTPAGTLKSFKVVLPHPGNLNKKPDP